MKNNIKIQEFFENLYYENDIKSFSNCFDYEKGEVDIEALIEEIENNNLSVQVIERL